MPRQIKAANLSTGCWRKSTEILPPDNVKVLCCAPDGQMWFDTFNQGWSSPIAPDLFAWQLVAKPIDFFFEL